MFFLSAFLSIYISLSSFTWHHPKQTTPKLPSLYHCLKMTGFESLLSFLWAVTKTAKKLLGGKNTLSWKVYFFDWLFIWNEEKYIRLHWRKLSGILILCWVKSEHFISLLIINNELSIQCPDHYQSDKMFCAAVLQKVLIKRWTCSAAHYLPTLNWKTFTI